MRNNDNARPNDLTIDGDIFTVLVNAEGQHSLWPPERKFRKVGRASARPHPRPIVLFLLRPIGPICAHAACARPWSAKALSQALDPDAHAGEALRSLVLTKIKSRGRNGPGTRTEATRASRKAIGWNNLYSPF
jgi:MbtH-like protein